MAAVEIGFIGCGSRAQDHYTSLAAMDDVDIVATCDIDESALSETADRYDIPNRYTDYEVMLDEHEFDGVYMIMSPTFLDPIVTDVLDRGENVFIEKPPGVHSEQTRRWAELADRNGCHTCVGFQRRFHPVSVEARRRIEEQSDVRYGVATFHKHTPEWTNQLHDDVMHVIDLLCWMGDGIEDVHGFHGQLFTDPTDFDQFNANVFVGVFEFANGGIGILNANRTAGGRDLEFEMHGNAISTYGGIHGAVETDELVVQADGESYGDVEQTSVADLFPSAEPETKVDGTFQINRHFTDCLRENQTPDVTFADVIESMEAMEAITHGERLPTDFDE
jgi:virulence factor